MLCEACGGIDEAIKKVRIAKYHAFYKDNDVSLDPEINNGKNDEKNV